MNQDIGLLLLRAYVGGGMLIAHGLPKLFSYAEKSGNFPDPLGVGTSASLMLVIFSEVLCALFVALGIKTRYTAIPLFITMMVAAFIIHASDPFAVKELAILYGVGYLTLIFTGGGQLTVEKWFK
jgi:putative oxidoreductase